MYDELYPLVNTFGMPDTVGIATPQLVAKRVRELRRRYPKAALECHFHNDRGLALANSLAAIEQGASYIDTSVWGLAERSGITSITALLFNLYYENKNLCKDYSLEVCYPLNVLMGTILKLQVPSSEPVSLTNRTHTAGVHQKAVLNNPHVYEGHDLSIFGVHTNHLFLGPLSGKNIIYYYLREVCYREVDVQQAALIAQKFKARTQEMNKKNRPEKILLELAQEMNLPKRAVRENYLLRRVENCN